MAALSGPRRLTWVALVSWSVCSLSRSAPAQEPAAPVADDAFVTLAIDEARGCPLPTFLRLVEEAIGTKLEIGEAWREGAPRPPIRCLGTMRIRRTGLLECARTLLWANEWTCSGEGSAFVVAPRGSKPAPGKVTLTPCVESARLPTHSDAAHSPVLAVIDAGRSITLAAAATDLAAIDERIRSLGLLPVVGARPALQAGAVRLESDSVIMATDEERGLPLRNFLDFVEKFAATKLRFDETERPEATLCLLALGSIKIQKADFLPWTRAMLWANGWACLPGAEGHDVVRRTSERALKLQDAVPWVAPDRVADLKDKPNTFLVTTIDLADEKRALTFAGAGPDVHLAVETLARLRKAKTPAADKER